MTTHIYTDALAVGAKLPSNEEGVVSLQSAIDGALGGRPGGLHYTFRRDGRTVTVDVQEDLTAEQVAALDIAVGTTWNPSPSEDEIDAGTELELSGLQNARRKAFDRMVSKTMRLLLQTGAAANKDEAVTMGRAFMFPHRSARLEWVDTGYDVPVLAAITADTTPWLDFAHGNQSIRDYILSVFEG